MILDEFKLDGDVALLTCLGKNRLPGLSMALAEAGAKVFIAGAENDDIHRSVIRAGMDGLDIDFLTIDLSSGSDIDEMVDRIISRHGKLDILVNNMNPEFAKPLMKTPTEEWESIVNTNLRSLFLCTRAAARHMVEINSGRIVNIASGLSQRGMKSESAYCSVMGGILQMTRSLAMEWAEKNVRVNAVGTGWMEDDLSDGQKDIMSKYIPMRRLAIENDILPLILFMASTASSYMTGYIYFADGGLMARG